MSAADDGGDPLYSAIVAITKRRLAMSQMYESVGLGSSQYNELRKTGDLLTPDRVFSAARYFGINPVALLAECGLIDKREAVDFANELWREATAVFGTDVNPQMPTRKGGTATATVMGRKAKLSSMPIRSDAAPL